MDTFIFSFVSFILTFIVVKIFINPIKRFIATFGESAVHYTVDGVGYRIIGKHKVEVTPIKLLNVEESASLVVPNKYEMKIKHSNEKSYLEIPEEIENKRVISIGKRGLYGFRFCYVKLPSSIRFIKDEAFVRCLELLEISLPDSVESIGSFAFENCCSLEIIILGSGVKKIGNCAFALCHNLREIHCKGLPPSVGVYTFNKVLLSQCKLFVKSEYIGCYLYTTGWKDFTHIEVE